MKNLKNLMPLFAIILGLGLVFTQSAFKDAPEKRTSSYFQYVGSTFDDTNYKDIDNWNYVSDPETPTCIGSEEICVLRVDDMNLTAPGTKLQQLDDFFNSQLTDPNEVRDFVENPSNIHASQDN